MGAVNTLVWDELGYDGFNTDGWLPAVLADRASHKGHVVLVDAGGAVAAGNARSMK